MPIIYRDDGSYAWGTITAVIVALVAVFGVGFLVYAQSQAPVAIDRDTTTIVQPAAQPAQPTPTVIPMPMPGPAGPAGAAGAPGAAGSPGAPAPAAPAEPAPAAPLAPRTQ